MSRSQDEAVLEFLQKQLRDCLSGQKPKTLSPVKKTRAIILCRVIMHQTRDNPMLQMAGLAFINALGFSEWPTQPVRESTTELTYRTQN